MGKRIPPPPGPGRPKGSKNKFTTLKQAFLDAFELIGGTPALADWAKKSERNRGIFYQLVTKLFPQEVAHSGAGPDNSLVIQVVHTHGANPGGGNGDGEK